MADTVPAGRAPTSAVAHAVGRPSRAAAVLMALTLASGWLLVASAAPAHAVEEWGIEQPASGSTVTGPTHVRAFARAVKGEQVEGMRVRFRSADGGHSGQTRALSFTDSEQDAGTERSTWARPFDPLASDWHGGAVMPNGRYVIEAQAVSSVESIDFGDELRRESDWRGHQITVDAPPPPTSASARVTDPRAGTVEVAWTASVVPDFRRYVVQRAPAGGDFTDVHTADDSAAASHIDRVDGDGEYRYRVRVVRGGVDGERESVSEPAAVTVQDPASEGDDGEDPDDAGSADEDDVDDVDDEDGDPGGAGAAPSPGSADPPQLSTRSEGSSGSEPSDATPETREPQTAPGPGVDDDFEPPSGDVFEENLDYDVAEGRAPQAAEQEQAPRAGRAGEQEPVPREQASGAEGSRLTIWDGRELDSQEVLVPVATGLVLILGGLHLRRFLNP